MTNQIFSAAKYVENISICVAGVSDLRAPNCLKTFLRETAKAEAQNMSVDLAMIWLRQELQHSAKEGHVLELEQGWLH